MSRLEDDRQLLSFCEWFCTIWLRPHGWGLAAVAFCSRWVKVCLPYVYAPFPSRKEALHYTAHRLRMEQHVHLGDWGGQMRHRMGGYFAHEATTRACPMILCRIVVEVALRRLLSSQRGAGSAVGACTPRGAVSHTHGAAPYASAYYCTR